MGYPVTVFEALPIGGGMLSVAIPDFRLPREVIEKEIDYIAKRGVEIKYDTPINVNFTVEDIKDSGFEAVFIAAGAQKSQSIGIPGELDDMEGFYYGLRFLRDVKVGKPVKIGRRVAVIGGGNVALDSSRTALRLGADEVSIFYRRSREEMPVTEVEYDETLAEGVQVDFLVSPTRVVSDNWKVTGLQCVHMKLGEPDASGRRRPIPIEGSEFDMDMDTVIMALGTRPNPMVFTDAGGLERTKWGTVVADEETGRATKARVWAGGDVVTGAATVISAMGAGKRAAADIDHFLSGEINVEGWD